MKPSNKYEDVSKASEDSGNLKEQTKSINELKYDKT